MQPHYTRDNLRKKIAARTETTAAGCLVWTGCRMKSGYGVISIGQHKSTLVHRVSYWLEHGELPDGFFVCHKCDNPPCCLPSHLFLGTNADNLRDCSKKGRMHPGESHGMATLKEKDVVFIYQTFLRGEMAGKDLATMFGVSRGTVCDIVKRRTWRRATESLVL